MESTTTTTNDQQTPPIVPMMMNNNNSSSRRKQSKPNRLEHVVLESTPAACDTINSSSILPSLTQYHVAAEQQESGVGDDDSDRVSLNCEDGSLSSHSIGEHYAMEDIINRSRRPSHQQQQQQHQSRSNDKTNFDENIERMLIEENEQQEHIDHDNQTIGVLDFSLKLDETNKHAINRSRSSNTTGKSRSLKRKHQNGLTDNNHGTITMPTRIFHADAFCTICRKEFCNKYFLKTHLANKHGIFDQQSVVPSTSTPNLSSLQGNTDTTNDSNLHHHPFIVISTLLNNGGHEDFSSSPISSSSDIIRNHRNNDDDNETELSSLRHEMNGVIAGGDDDNDNHHHDHERDEDNEHDDDDDDDEQDGINSNSLNNLPHKIATILCHDNLDINPDNDDDDDDRQELIASSPTNSLDFQQQQQASSSSTVQLSGLPPTSSSTATTNLSRQSSAKLPEDFCDICQKHFCNKYYLRKHRLDVHGVQTDSNIKPYKRIDSNSLSTKNSPPTTATTTSLSSQQISPSIQLSSSFPNMTFTSSSVQQSLGMLLNPIFSPLVQSQTNSEQILLASNKRRHTDNSSESSLSSKTPFPPSLLTVASDVATAFANQLNSVTNNSTNTSAAISSSSKSQISTCHLCGKKFQSNDYLQLHLMNKHQIKIETQNYDAQQQQQRAKLSNLIKSSNGTLNSNTVKKIKLETNETPSSLSPSALSNITTTTVIKASAPMDVISSPNPPVVIPGIVDTYFAAKMADRVSCDMCHKQVCNKYFLKTHKLKVHGVTSDPIIGSSSVSLNNSETTEDNIEQQYSRSSLDGSPPQLVVDELNLANTEPGVIPSPDALTASVNTFIGTNANSASNDSLDPVTTSICELCSKSFPTKFLHVHMNNVHGIQQSPILLTNGTTNTMSNNKNQLTGNTIKRTLSNGSHLSGSNSVRLKQTPQVQLRVTCQVCKKELCNKYFLRAHMRNVHNISVDDLRLIQQQSSTSQLSPSSDHQSSKSMLSLSSNLLSSTSTIPTDLNLLSSRKHSLSDDNDLNGHTTDSNESENINFNHLSSSSTPTTISSTNKIGTNDNNNNNNRLLSMQPFLVESDDDLYKDLFVPCMVYLPCRHRVTKPLEVSLRLKPVDNTTSTSSSTSTTTTTATIAD